MMLALLLNLRGFLSFVASLLCQEYCVASFDYLVSSVAALSRSKSASDSSSLAAKICYVDAPKFTNSQN